MTNKHRLLIEHLHPEIKSPIKMGLFDTKIEAEQAFENLNNAFTFRIEKEKVNKETTGEKRASLTNHETQEKLDLLLSAEHILSMNKVYTLKEHFGSEFRHTGIFAFFNNELLFLSPSGETIVTDYINHYSESLESLVEEVSVSNETLISYKELRDLILLKKTLLSYCEKVSLEFRRNDNSGVLSKHVELCLKVIWEQIESLENEIQSTSLNILTEGFSLN